MTRDTHSVASEHLDAVRSGEPAAMAADYANSATLHRAGEVFRGRTAIEAYFKTVPERLGDAKVVFDDLSVSENVATFRWHLEGTATPVSGTDTCTIEDGMIVKQVVALDRTDF